MSHELGDDDTRKVRVGEVIAVLGGAILLVASWVAVTAADRLPQWEANLFEAVNDLPDWLWPVLWTPMQVGSYVGSLVVVAMTWLVSRDLRLTLAALVASQLAFWLVEGGEEVGAPRDGQPSCFSDVHLREDAHGLGYVSGHTAVAFALAAVLAPSLPRKWQLVDVRRRRHRRVRTRLRRRAPPPRRRRRSGSRAARGNAQPVGVRARRRGAAGRASRRGGAVRA